MDNVHLPSSYNYDETVMIHGSPWRYQDLQEVAESVSRSRSILPNKSDIPCIVGCCNDCQFMNVCSKDNPKYQYKSIFDMN